MATNFPVTAGMKMEGLDAVQDLLGNVGPRTARNLNRAAIHAVAGKIRDEARQRVPKDTGTLKRAVKAIRRRPRNPDRPFSDVRVDHGTSAKHDAWYWHFVEYGTAGHETNGPIPARPFIKPAVMEVKGNVTAIYRREFAKKLAKALMRKGNKIRR